jgi:hypothetical protein
MVNFTLNAYGYFEQSAKSWIYFAQPFRPRSERRYALRHGIDMPGDALRSKLGSKLSRRNLMKVEAPLTALDIEALFRANLERMPKTFAGLDFRTTRMSHQAGGVYFPSFRHDALVSSELTFQRLDSARSLANPSVAILERTTHVQEMLAFRTIEPFYFRHDPNCVIDGFPLNYLWPDKSDDLVYAAVCRLAEEHCRTYLDHAGVEADDMFNGILDPGYVRAD